MEQEGRVAADQDDAALIAYHQLRADSIRKTRAQMAEILVPDRIARRDLCARPGVDADRAALAHETRVLRNRPRRFEHEARWMALARYARGGQNGRGPGRERRCR